MAIRDPSDDDGLEIEVVPASADASRPAPAAAAPAAPAGPPTGPRAPRRRTPNPIVDEVIHSGEIEQPRSMIVRAGTPPPMERIEAKIEVREDPTEVVSRTPAPAPAPEPARKKTWLLLVAAAVPAAIAVALLVLDHGSAAASAQAPQVSEATRTELQAAGAFVGTTLDADARAASVRAEAMASSSMLRAAIETDAQTLADMAKDKDVAFPIQAHEQLEIIQVQSGKSSTLLRLPEGAPALQAPEPGKSRIDVSGSGLTVVASAAVTSQRPDISGQLVLAVPVSLDEMRKRVADHVVHAELVGLAQPVVLVAAGPEPAGEKLSIPIETESHAKLSLEATLAAAPAIAAPAGHGKALRIARYACMGLAAALLLGFFATTLRRA